jgi:hypothetical protein
MNTVKSFLSNFKWTTGVTHFNDYEIENFCLYFLKCKPLDFRAEVSTLYNERYSETKFISILLIKKFSNDEIEKFCLEFLAAKALDTFAYYVAMGGKKPCKGCGMEIYEFAKYSSKPHYRAQTACEDCRFVDYSGMDDDDCYDDYHGGDYRQEQYDQWRDFAKNECS